MSRITAPAYSKFSHRSHTMAKRRSEPSPEGLVSSQFLHDCISSNLAVLKMQVSWIQKKAKTNAMRRELESINQLIDQLIGSIREAGKLGSNSSQTPLLFTAIRNCAQAFQERTRIATCVKITGDDAGISPGVSKAVLAILQEALANVVRHADATAVQIHVTHERASFTIVLLDNGKGMAQERLKRCCGFGLSSMRQRAERLGGSIQYCSAPRSGFEILVRIPCTRRAACDGDARGQNSSRLLENVRRLTSEICELSQAAIERSRALHQEVMVERIDSRP